MIHRLRTRLTYANVIATLALFIALGGSAYAGLTLPKGSVGTKQLKNNAVTSKKVKNGTLRLGDFNRAQRDALRGPAGPQGQPGSQGPKGDQGDAGSARAYAHVTRSAGDFVVDATRTKNVVDVTLPTTGNNDRPCLILPPSIDASTAVAIGTVDAANTATSETATVQHRVGAETSQGCPGNAIALYLKRNGTGSTDTIAFNVMVP